MKIAVAPYMPILAPENSASSAFANLSLESMPSYLIVLVPSDWLECIYNMPYELLSLLQKLNYQECPSSRKSQHIKTDPDILSVCPSEEQVIAKQQLLELSGLNDFKRIFAGINVSHKEFDVICDKKAVPIIHHNPYGTQTLCSLISSFEPTLHQLKHTHEPRKRGENEISPFSAYNKQDETYARKLLKQAYEEHDGDVTDMTYLYTYDSKNRTFVEFRPDRNNVYHGMDITKEKALKEAPDIVKLYHQ